MRLDDPIFEKMKAAVKSYHPKAMRIPGVHATSVGFKEVEGELTETVAIRIYLTKKRPIDEVPVDERIPEEIEGFPTDVVEREPVRPLWNETKYRPVEGGCLLTIAGPIEAHYGTLGCMVKDKTDNAACGLSNQHVLDYPYSYLGQPKGGIAYVIGKQKRNVLSKKVDGGIFSLDVGYKADIVGIGKVAGSANIPFLGVRVRKSGARTLLTEGQIISDYVSGTRSDGWHYENQFEIQAAHGVLFCDHGDSGSVIVDDRNMVVGLLWGGNIGIYGFASPIAYVLSELNIEVVSSQEALSLPPAQSYGETLEGQLEALLCQSARGRQYWHVYSGYYSTVEHMFHIIPRLHAIWLKIPRDELIAAVTSGIMNPDSKIPATLGSEDTATVLETVRSALASYLEGDNDPPQRDIPQQINSLFNDIAANIGGSWRDAISDKQLPQ